MTPDQLKSCFLKIERGKEHRTALEAFVKETFADASKRPRVGIKVDQLSGDRILYVSAMPELNSMMERCGLIFGDAVHNLISALDHLVYQLALSSQSGQLKKPNRVHFPICDTEESFANAKSRFLSEVDNTYISTLEKYQGFHELDANHQIGSGYFHPLVMLRDLASIDKHRLLIDLVVPTSGLELTNSNVMPLLLAGILEQFSGARLGTYIGRSPPATLDAEIARARVPLPASEMVGFALPAVAVGDHSAGPLLDKIIRVVNEVVDEFKSGL